MKLTKHYSQTSSMVALYAPVNSIAQNPSFDGTEGWVSGFDEAEGFA